MPELPEVETVIKYLKDVCLNKPISKVEVRLIKLVHEIEIDDFIKQFKNRCFIDVMRKGKYILFILDNQKVLVSHLRMEGKYIYEADSILTKHDHLIFHFKDHSALKYNDTRQFGTFHFFKDLETAENSKILSKLGIEPFSDFMKLETIYPLMQKCKKPIKTFLLDQSKIAGIGNIYANEICFAVHLDPTTPTNLLTKKNANDIIVQTKQILADSIAHNGTTIHSFKFSKWQTGEYQQYLKVHQQTACPSCHTPLKRYFVGQRGTFSCPKCQKRGK